MRALRHIVNLAALILLTWPALLVGWVSFAIWAGLRAGWIFHDAGIDSTAAAFDSWKEKQQ